MYFSTTAISKSETLRIALRTYYEKLSSIIYNVRYAIGEVSYTQYKATKGLVRDDRGSVVSTLKVEKGPKHLAKLCSQYRLAQQVRSYTTKGEKRKLVPVVELHKDFQILAKH